MHYVSSSQVYLFSRGLRSNVSSKGPIKFVASSHRFCPLVYQHNQIRKYYNPSPHASEQDTPWLASLKDRNRLPAKKKRTRLGRLSSSLIKFSQEVKEALARRKPIVALETAIYTHGVSLRRYVCSRISLKQYKGSRILTM